ncbi:MAG: hypothetical protein AB9834_24105 [Lentimicrobium sp.]
MKRVKSEKVKWEKGRRREWEKGRGRGRGREGEKGGLRDNERNVKRKVAALKGRNIITMGEAKQSPWLRKPERK